MTVRVTPKVAVIMTVFNGEEFLLAALESLQAQSLTDFCCHVVDDGSTDSSPTIVESLGRSDDRFRLIRAGRLGRGRALNVALEASGHAPFVANLDADDLAQPRRLEKQVAFLEGAPQVGLVGSYAILDHGTHQVRYRRPTSPRALRRRLLRDYPFVHSSVTYRGEAIRGLGGFSTNISCCLDYDMAARIAEHYEVANIPEYLCVHRKYNPTFFKSLKKEEFWTTRSTIAERYAKRGRTSSLDRALEALVSRLSALRTRWQTRQSP